MKLERSEAATQIEHILTNFDWEEVLRIMRDANLPWFENRLPTITPHRASLRRLCENMLWQVATVGGDEMYGYFRARLHGTVLELEFVIECFTGVPEAMFDEKFPVLNACEAETN